MRKIIAHIVAFSVLACFAVPALATVTIPNYGPRSFCALLTGIASAVAGLIATAGTVMIIVAGIFYLTSAGSPERIGVAKKTLIYAIVGIAISLAAGVIITIVKTAINASTPSGQGC